MANLVYNNFKKEVNGGIDWDDNSSTTIKCMLVTSSYTPDADTHAFKDDVTNEVTGTGYTAGGKEIINRTITVDNVNDIGVYDGDDIEWTSSTITARGAVIYKDTGTASTSPLITYIDFGADKISDDGSFTIQWHTDGIFKLA